jgi:predicted acyltransferase
MPTRDASAPAPSERLLSLDLFRGLTKFLLIGESARIFERLVDPAFGGTVLAAIGAPFGKGLFSWLGPPGAPIIASLAAWLLLWYMCFWRYKRRILIKI